MEDKKKQKQMRRLKIFVWAFIVITFASYAYSIYNIVKLIIH